jgi:hypothetical protein
VVDDNVPGGVLHDSIAALAFRGVARRIGSFQNLSNSSK